MSKKELRKKYAQLRKTLTSDQVEEYSLQIANQALKLDIWEYSNYHIFLPIERHNEVDTEYLLHILQGKDKNIIISKSNFDDFSMSHYLLTDQTKIINNEYGIPEPHEEGIRITDQQLDVVFVPLLAVDKFGNRVGYGKGFYDRFLKKCKPGILKVGLSFFEPLNNKIDVNDEDIKLDYIVTNQNAFKVVSNLI
ncbi:5-formyltetrahydrofolate cyclo-ligase [uncultured Nonlabens sp.]|uniref:5-formyltetrahydrofolate cyclo-ligase n=1 Tax=uncultured Nonlabens sp. TaxID=859306 RepID=UPI00262BA4DD|nr:5-formyltetrahydrofolate cyclo-ligase [uncultured Nonlabens sp.]